MECDGCTLCCKLLDIPWMDSPSGHVCKFCEIGVGCRIYDKAPKDCLEFKCAYAQMEKANIKMRPDHCHVIFEKMADDMIYGTLDPYFEINEHVKIQIGLFHKEGMTVIINDKNKLKISPKEGLNVDKAYQYYVRLKDLRNGNS